MNFLVVSRISIPATDRTLPAWNYLRSLGHTVAVEHPGVVHKTTPPDAIISMGITVMTETFEAMERFPGVPTYMYNWDVYKWVWEPGQEGKKQAYHAIRNEGQQREYDYVKYGDLLRRAREVWVPSTCTGRRTKQWYGLDRWSVILSACPWWDHPNVRDDGYALCCLREIPDPHWGMFERACDELGIPYKMPKHELPYAEYQDMVAGCRFLCAPLYELSTGGLSLLEGYYLGKPVLISDSEWNAGKEYFGNRALYSKAGDYEDLKIGLNVMYRDSPRYPADKYNPDHKEWITTNFSDKRMVDDMLRRIEATR